MHYLCTYQDFAIGSGERGPAHALVRVERGLHTRAVVLARIRGALVNVLLAAAARCAGWAIFFNDKKVN